MRALAFVAGTLGVGAVAYAVFGDAVIAWASAQQRVLQSELATAILAVRDGDTLAVAAVIGVCALYGVVHAVGPGHGKLLIGGASLASQRTARRMAGLGLAASVAQAGTAILLVYGGLSLFSVAGRDFIGVSEKWLTAASHLAIAAIGAWILWRGARLASDLMKAPKKVDHGPTHSGCGAGCRHAPTVAETEKADSWRDALALIASIGVRPCSGALVVLVLAWRFETYAVGAAAVVAMALGTGVVVAAIALAAVKLRDAGGLSSASAKGLWGVAALQLGVGGVIAILSGALAVDTLTPSQRSHPLMKASAEAAAPIITPPSPRILPR